MVDETIEEEVLDEQATSEEAPAEVSVEEEIIEEEDLNQPPASEQEPEQEVVLEEVIISKEELAIQAAEEAERAATVKREAEHKREADILARREACHDFIAACNQVGVSNADLYFNQQILHPNDRAEGIIRLEAIEKKDADNKAALEDVRWLEGRQEGYAHIDKLLLEALAEQASGSPEKMQIYLGKRAEIKLKFPKP